MLRNTAIATLFFSGIAIATTLPAHALELARYEFGTSASPTLASIDADPNSEAAPFSANGVLTPSSGEYVAGVSGLAINRSGWTGTAINLSRYYTFTVTPSSGASMSLSSLTFAARRSSTSAPGTIEVRSSRDGYSTALSTLVPGTGVFISGLSTPLTGSQFQNLTESVTFRIYGYGATNTNGTLGLDNVTLDGTVAVPFGFTPIWGIAANGIVFGLRKLRSKQTKSGSDSLTAEA